MRVYLTGFMGSGKTQVGAGLARLLSYPFVDLDEVLVDLHSLTISEQFERFGEPAFRERERDVLLQTASMQQAVFACGGGTPCFFDNMKWMNLHGLTIFLDVPTSILADRLLPEMAKRPLLQALSADTLPQYINRKMQERLPYYRQAQLTVPATLPVPALCEHIYQQLLQRF